MRWRFFSLLLRSARSPRVWRPSRQQLTAGQRFAATGSLVGILFYTASAKSLEENSDPPTWNNYYKDTAVRKRFLSFATLCYNDEPFMTGEDFIAAIASMSYIKERPVLLHPLSEEEYTEILENATTVDLDDVDFLKRPDYIISYSEFLFLMSVIVKPIDQFSRHFRILDRAGTNTLSKEEFLSVESLTSGGSNPLERATTSMQILLFGRDQTQEVNFEQFSKFLHGIQRQCLKAEFEAYSSSKDYITDDEFMRLLLRRTLIPDIKKARYIDRLESRPAERRNKIIFHQFCQFMNLLNDFPDFEVAIRMFAITKKALTKADFQRAVKASTGTEFDQELVDVVFDVFDEDNDNKLGHDEFIKVMKDSIKSRNALSQHIQSNQNGTGWAAYQTCVKQFMQTH